MEVTLENIALISIALATVAIVGALVMSIMNVNVELMRRDLIVNVHDTERHDGKTWFILSVTYEGSISGVSLYAVNGAPCSVNASPYSQSTWEVYGYCEGDVDVIVVSVEGSNGRSETSVKL
ncbi:MAG: hypothetical protein QXO55_06155 [Candidatus Korarchaeum sp.]